MITLLSTRRVCLAIIVCVCLAQGCSSKKASLAPVSGKVTVDGQPVTSGQVSFFPAEKKEDAAKTGLAAGNIESDGTYTISTDGKKGAPLGKYKVSVTPSMMPTGDKAPTTPFNQQYKNADQSGLTVEVVADPEPGRYDLKLTK
jgi:hypothetical protein